MSEANPYQAPVPSDPQPPMPDDGIKTRHGCVTAYLIFMLIVNAITSLANLLMADEIQDLTPGMPGWALPVLSLLGVLNVVFAVLLFRWKKIGFFGFVGTSVLAAIINLSAGLAISQVVGGLIGIGILYAILQIGSPKSAWAQLE
ncbi:hypothetical protein G6O69_14235 [Pseudenhygromyxa sp. WMMC2535]|uniref:hypothetical protein n=1 Tax=Pseudenhygromyxa sp. WMMC2535 TaxID=2712867 RepID=UPI001552CF9C|nr:hypothetical protein [Pseudenhygromyxa sp. WMMC2535]NVB38997.1 hypothetical protein [Pseudenhygromyxa sp. WMMC2535]